MCECLVSVHSGEPFRSRASDRVERRKGRTVEPESKRPNRGLQSTEPLASAFGHYSVCFPAGSANFDSTARFEDSTQMHGNSQEDMIG